MVLASTYTVQAQKPSSSATVRQAFLLAASSGFSDYRIPNGAAGIRLNGVGITWTREISSAIVSRNYQADVTSLIKPALDTTGTGRTTFTITETNSNVIDGVVLAVVWNDPAQTGNSTVVLRGHRGWGLLIPEPKGLRRRALAVVVAVGGADLDLRLVPHPSAVPAVARYNRPKMKANVRVICVLLRSSKR